MVQLAFVVSNFKPFSQKFYDEIISNVSRTWGRGRGKILEAGKNLEGFNFFSTP
jgi:hypothetical protein